MPFVKALQITAVRFEVKLFKNVTLRIHYIIYYNPDSFIPRPSSPMVSVFTYCKKTGGWEIRSSEFQSNALMHCQQVRSSGIRAEKYLQTV